ncbi:MAG: translocation/assembly module TamB domain-containing protein [Acinetobacter sp.]|nr:translocation/assembly module TamB domain-containing protein [Acinetobacter sp.]
MATSQKKRFSWKTLIVSLLLIIILALASVVAMLSTDRGSRFFFERVLSHQQKVSYQYVGGNLWQGITLNQLLVDLAPTQIKADSAVVHLGWRAILAKEAHFFKSDVKNLQIIHLKPSDGKPFSYPELKLPVTLRFNQLNVDQLTIQTLTATTKIQDIQLNDAVWNGTHLSFENAHLNLYGVFISDATGDIDFSKKYPLHLNAQVQMPALKNLNIEQMTVSADGDLSRINAGVATYTPDLLTGWAVVHPMDNLVPMKGELQLKDYHLPFLSDEQLLAKDGTIAFAGNIQGFDLELNSDLSGKNIPAGQYVGQMHTNFTERLDIHRLTADVIDGQVELKGTLNWADSKNIHWQAAGDFASLKPSNELLSAEIQKFLPSALSGQFTSQGVFNDGLKTKNSVQFSNQEQWQVAYEQADLKQSQQVKTLDVAWKNLNRELPYINGVHSPSGDAKIHLYPNHQQVEFRAAMLAHAQGILPQGGYAGALRITPQQVDVSQFHYALDDAKVSGTALVKLPQKNQALHWQTQLDLQNFNPQLIAKQVPVERLTGQVNVSGYAKDDQTQIIQTKGMNLKGKLAKGLTPDNLKVDWVHLTGDATIALLFHPSQQGGGFKSYAVQYDGDLKAIDQVNGRLQFKIAGTPDYINIEQFYHDGVAGKMNAKGTLDLADGIRWNVQSNLLHFKPQFFYAPVQGDISGIVQTRGEWSAHKKQVDVEQLNIAGTINGKALRGVGQLSVDLSQLDKGLKYQQFNANQLQLSYANNQVQVSGNQQGLNMKVNAAALQEIHRDLAGRVFGELTLSRQNRLQIHSNLAIDQFAYGDMFKVQRVRLQGELPISETVPSQLVLSIENASAFNRVIEQAKASLTGTYMTHMLKVDSKLAQSTFNIQLAGGFNKRGQWLGQIQQGAFNTPRMSLLQNRPADIVYHINKQQLKIAAHCWNNRQNQICFDQDITASPEHATASLMTKNIYLQDLNAIIPDGMEITGQLNGYAKASWTKGKQPQLDAQLFTRKGTIGLLGEDVNDPSTTLNYDELSMVAQTTPQGLLLRTDLKTPDIGTGYAKVLVQPEQKGMPISGEVAFNDVQLQVLRPFIQDVRKMSGSLSIAGKIDGLLTQPNFYGDFRLKDGIFSLNSLPVDLSNINLYGAIRQNKADLKGVFNSGKGVATLTGQAAWIGQPYLRLKLKGDQLLVRQPPQITATVNPDLSLEILPKQQRLTLDGSVQIPRALITMPESKATAIEVSPDVRIVRANQDRLATLKSAKAWDIRANIGVTLGEQVIFQGFDARVPMGGKLDLVQRGKEIAMRARGAIGSTKKVAISAYGQTLDLNRAIARFNGALVNPTLDIDANKSVQGNTVGVRVLGTALAPNIKIYSDAGLSEQEALNALLTGRISEGSASTTSTDSFKSDVNNAVAAAGISMGLGGTRALTNQIGQAFGLSGLALDAQGTGDDTQVSLTGYITPDLYLRYGVGVFTSVNKLTLRYQINQRLYLEASQDLERAIDLFYNWRF